jgi:hypothetical protein
LLSGKLLNFLVFPLRDGKIDLLPVHCASLERSKNYFLLFVKKNFSRKLKMGGKGGGGVKVMLRVAKNPNSFFKF